MQKRLFKKLSKILKLDIEYVTVNSFWIFLNNSFFSIFSIILSLVFANFTPKETFGDYQYILTTISLVSIFSLPGINTALSRSVSLGFDGSLKKAHEAKIKWGLLSSLSLILISIFYFIKDNRIFGFIFLISSFIIPLKNSYEIFLFFLEGKKKFKEKFKYETFVNTIHIIVMITTVILTKNLIIICLIFLLSRTILEGLIFTKIKNKKQNNIVDENITEYGKELTKINGFTLINLNFEKILIWHILGPVAVATYTFSIMPIRIIKRSIPIEKITLPKISSKTNINKKNITSRFIKLTIFCFLIFVFCYLVIPIFYRVFLKNYTDSIIYLQVILLTIILIPTSLLKTYLIAFKKTDGLKKARTTSFIVKTFFFIILLPKIGIWGAIIGIVLSNIISSLIIIISFFKEDFIYEEKTKTVASKVSNLS